jgi:hypothetical protein
MRALETLSLSLLVSLGVACADGPSDETLVDELRVMAIQADPPEAAPGQEVSLTAAVADPQGAGADVLLWHCTDLGEGCVEDGTEHAWSLALDDGLATATATVPAALAPFASEEPLRATLLWALACEPGLCPQVDDPAGWDLSDPASWLEELPMQGVSLGFNLLAISSREDGLDNPELELLSDAPLEAAPGELLTLDFSVQLDVAATVDTLAFGYATAGGFDAAEYAVGDDGAVSLAWYAPDQAATVELWVIVNDGAGGVGLWSGQVGVAD